MAAVPPAPSAEIWVDNPNVGNLNPGTKPRQEFFENKTKGLQEENRITATKKDSQDIRLNTKKFTVIDTTVSIKPLFL